MRVKYFLDKYDCQYDSGELFYGGAETLGTGQPFLAAIIFFVLRFAIGNVHWTIPSRFQVCLSRFGIEAQKSATGLRTFVLEENDCLDQALASFELGRFLSSDFDGFTCARVAAGAGRFVNNAKGAKANEGNFVTFGQLFFDDIDISVQGFASINFC